MYSFSLKMILNDAFFIYLNHPYGKMSICFLLILSFALHLLGLFYMTYE